MTKTASLSTEIDQLIAKFSSKYGKKKGLYWSHPQIINELWGHNVSGKQQMWFPSFFAEVIRIDFERAGYEVE